MTQESAEAVVRTVPPSRRGGRRGPMLVAAMALLSMVALAWPSPRRPFEAPSVRLQRAAVRACRLRDRRAVQESGHSGATAGVLRGEYLAQLRRLYRAQSLAETNFETRQVVSARARRRADVLAKMPKASKASALTHLRAELATRFEQVLLDDVGHWPGALVGTFSQMLTRYGVLQGDRLVAPGFIARTLFKARINAVFERSLTEGFQAVEREAYRAWFVVHGPDTQRALRLTVAAKLGRVVDAPEAQAWITARGNRGFERSQGVLSPWARGFSHLRKRNRYLAALVLGSESTDSDRDANLRPGAGNRSRGARPY